MPRFNSTNGNIDWAPYTWNPITGCMSNCKTCYARDIINRNHSKYPNGFEPTFYPERLLINQRPRRNGVLLRDTLVCTCSTMGDICGKGVKESWRCRLPN